MKGLGAGAARQGLAAGARCLGPLAAGLLLLLPLPGCVGDGRSSRFDLAATPDALTVPAGGSGHVILTAARARGLQGPITVDLVEVPFGVTGRATFPAAAGSARVVIGVASEVAPQTFHAAFVARSGGLAQRIPFTLVVAPPLPKGELSPDRLQASGGHQTGPGFENHALLGEPNAILTSQDAGAFSQVRSGFHPAASPTQP